MACMHPHAELACWTPPCRPQLALNVAALILLARLIEPVYGSREFIKLLAIVNCATTVCVFVGVYISYAATMNASLLYTEFYGFHGIAAGLLVAVKQILGDQEVKLFGVVRINVRVRRVAS
jgi:hypothetical protein